MGMRTIIIIAAWLGVFAVAAYLRLDELGSRPVHCDEATGARLLAKRMETGASQFDPTHFHGPLQSALAEPLCRWRGQTTWPELSMGTLRLPAALAGILTVMLPLGWRRRWGDAPMLLAAALLATSPLLAYYSRMFIHETLLGCCGLLALMALLSRPRYGLPGLFIGLMFAAKESFVISLIAWGCAGVALAVWHHRSCNRADWLAGWRRYRWPALYSGLALLLTAGWCYGDGFRQPLGLVAAVKTFFIYQTGEGHDQPFLHYLTLLLVPHKAAGLWWYGTPVAVLAVVAVVRSLLPGQLTRPQQLTVQFIALGAAAHFVGYGLIAYKTPWLMVLPWVQVCLLAGFSVVNPGALGRRWPVPGLAVLLVIFTLYSQTRQTRFAIGRLASDERNPFAYVPTRRNIEAVEGWLHQVAAVAPGGSVEPIAVIGTGYWPLPWYLRSFKTIGYWPQPPPDLARMPVVFAVPEVAPAVSAELSATHTPLPRGLRANVSVILYLRNDLWEAWQNTDRPR